ncbi:transient receptor potential cation channel subfamily M member 8-like [Glandiceps talaboti]
MADFPTGYIRVPLQGTSGSEDATDGGSQTNRQRNQETKNIKYLQVKKDNTTDYTKENIHKILLKVKDALGFQDFCSIPDVVYCIMSSESEVRVPTQMKTFLQKVLESALQTGALIVTNGIYHGITEMMCDILDELKTQQDGFCLQKDIHMIAIVPETQIADWKPQYKLDNKNQRLLTYIHPTSPVVGTKGPLEVKHHNYCILVEGDTKQSEQNILKASEIAVSLFTHFKNTYSNSLSKYVPKSGNEEREFSWCCDECGDRIVGSGFHCHACGDYDLCLVCKGEEKWLPGHMENIDKHRDQIMKFDTWNTGHYAPSENSKGSWRCTACGLHIWDEIYWCDKGKVCKDDVHCGECDKWRKYQSKHTGKNKEKLSPSDNKPVAVTWFLLQGGKVELKAGSEAMEKGVCMLTTYMDGGRTAEMAAFVCTQVAQGGEVSDNVIKSIVTSTLDTHYRGVLDDASEYEECLKKMVEEAKNTEVITCGIDVNEDGLSNIISGAILKAAGDSSQAKLQLAIAEGNLQEAQDILASNVNRQSVLYHDVMMSAIVLNKYTFLNLFLENGMPLQPFCNKQMLGNLYRCVLFYEDILKTKSNSCLQLVKHITRADKKDRHDYLKQAKHQEKLLEVISDLIESLTGGIFQPDYHEDDTYEYSEKDLYVWALLCGRIEMAKVIWTKASNHIALALLGSKILRCLKFRARDIEESYLVESLRKGERELAEMAKSSIQECYMDNKKKSHRLLVAPIDYLHASCSFNCLKLAWAFDMKEFMAKSCCQTKLTSMWHGKDRICAMSPIFEKTEKFLFAPRIQFMWNILTMIMLLIMLTTFVLTDLHPFGMRNAPSVLEIIVTVWVFLLTIEELRMISYVDRVGMCRKVKSLLLRQWNIIKACMLSLFWLSFILRFVIPPDYFVFVRIMYSLTLLAFYLNLLPLGFANDQLGPKLIMIKGMVKELLIFMTILVIFMLAFGTAYEALIHPNSPRNFILFGHILYRSYFQLLGDMLTDDIELKGVNSTCVKPYDPACVLETFLPILTAIYVLIANILLLNLLIAVFGFYIEDIQKRSKVVWSFYRYGLIKEYHNKAPFFPLGCPFYWIYLMCKQCVCCLRPCICCGKTCSCDKNRSRNIFSGKDLSDEEIFEVEDFEHSIVTLNRDKLTSIKIEEEEEAEDDDE